MRILLVSLILAIPLIGYLIYPLQSEAFKIVENMKLLEAKTAYLTEEVVDDSIDRWNVVWIMADDLGYFDTDLYSAEGYVQTPNLQRIAQRGTRFTNAYVTSPLCSPSRASVLTGRYNQRFGFEHQLHDRYLRNRMEYYGFKYVIDSDPWVPQYKAEVPTSEFMTNMSLPKSEITIAEILKKYNYRTGLIGKWHLSKSVKNSPNDFGFDEFYGFYSSHSLYSPEGTVGVTDVHNDKDWTDDYIWSGQRDGRQAIQRNGRVIEEARYLTNAITDESISFIKSTPEGQPFFLYASYNAPHTPFQAPDDYMKMFEDEEDIVKRVYYAMIKSLDDEIGRLLDFLEESGEIDQTVLCFVSDNGGAEYTYATDNQALRGGKITNFEGGVRVPMMMAGSGLPIGGLYDLPVSAMDLFSTTLSIVNVDLPEGRTFDGVDLVPHMTDNTTPHDYIYFRKGYNHGIRNMEYKMTWNSWTKRDTLLYHVRVDPGETNNMFDANNDMAAGLLSAYQSWHDEMIPPKWPSVIHYNYTDEQGTVYPFEN